MNRKRMNARLLLLILPCLAFTLADKPRDVNGPFYTGYIFSKHPYERSKSFLPTLTEIHEAELLLQKRVTAVMGSDFDLSEESLAKKQQIIADLALYKRRYFGIINTVKKKILLIEFVHPAVINDDAWKSPKWSLDGGGHWFWSIRFNISSGLFYDLWINANLSERKKSEKR